MGPAQHAASLGDDCLAVAHPGAIHTPCRARGMVFATSPYFRLFPRKAIIRNLDSRMGSLAPGAPRNDHDWIWSARHIACALRSLAFQSAMFSESSFSKYSSSGRRRLRRLHNEIQHLDVLSMPAQGGSQYRACLRNAASGSASQTTARSGDWEPHVRTAKKGVSSNTQP